MLGRETSPSLWPLLLTETSILWRYIYGSIYDIVWTGITSTRPDPVSEQLKLPSLSVGCASTSALYFQNELKSGRMEESVALHKFWEVCGNVLRLPSFRADSVMKCGIDARAIPASLIPHDGVIWYQCPWSEGWGETSRLIKSFLVNISRDLCQGYYVCVHWHNKSVILLEGVQGV